MIMWISAAFVVAATAAWRVCGTTVGARLASFKILPSGFVRRRLHIALELLRIQQSTTEEPCLELEDCVSDSNVSVIVDALDRLCSTCSTQTRALGALIVLRCKSLGSEGLRTILNVTLKSRAQGLKVLYIKDCPSLGNGACEMLGELLATENCCLRDLGVVGCGLNAAGISALSFSVSGFQLSGSASKQDMSAVGITDLLASTPPLLGAPPPTIDVAPAPNLSSAPDVIATTNLVSGLSTLQLSSNDLGGAGRSLAAIAKGLSQLHWLSLESCNLQFDDLQQIARALPRSKIARLDLADNTIRSRGLLAVISGIRMSRVEDLGLERNEIGIGEALNELKAVHDRRPFPILRLTGNRLTARQEAAFLQSLRSAPLKSLGASYCPPNCACFYGRNHVM